MQRGKGGDPCSAGRGVGGPPGAIWCGSGGAQAFVWTGRRKGPGKRFAGSQACRRASCSPYLRRGCPGAQQGGERRDMRPLFGRA